MNFSFAPQQMFFSTENPQSSIELTTYDVTTQHLKIQRKGLRPLIPLLQKACGKHLLEPMI